MASPKIIKGKIENKAVKCVIYGSEGIGKSTFAAQFPRPLFLDTEGSTGMLDVARFERPKGWDDIRDAIDAVRKGGASLCRTFVIDTADWMERLCETFVCVTHDKTSIEEFGYGKGYVMVREQFGKALDELTAIAESGVNVILTAHSVIRKFELPNETGAFDRYELKMGSKAGNQVAALCKEWADLVLFANYKEKVVEVNGKKKVQGGSRMMFTQHAPTWDAKNRFGLKAELPLDYKHIAPFVLTDDAAQEQPEPQMPFDQSRDGVDPRILEKADAAKVTLQEISDFARMSGCFSKTVEAKDFPKEFVDKVLMEKWEQVVAYIKENVRLKNDEIPF